MTVGCNIWMICLKLNGFFYDPSHVLQLFQFVWTLRSSVSVFFNNFLLIDATARSKISGDQKRFFIALSLYPLSFFVNTPFKNYKQFKTFKRNGGNLFRCSNKCIPKMLYRASCVTCWKRLHQDLFLTWLKMVPHLIYQCLYWFIILDSLGKLIHKKLET